MEAKPANAPQTRVYCHEKPGSWFATLRLSLQQAGFTRYVYALLTLPYLATIIALIVMSRKAKGPAWLSQHEM